MPELKCRIAFAHRLPRAGTSINRRARDNHTSVVRQSIETWQSGRSAIRMKPVTGMAYEAVQLIGS
jgi:hypothetical protein